MHADEQRTHCQCQVSDMEGRKLYEEHAVIGLRKCSRWNLTENGTLTWLLYVILHFLNSLWLLNTQLLSRQIRLYTTTFIQRLNWKWQLYYPFNNSVNHLKLSGRNPLKLWNLLFGSVFVTIMKLHDDRYFVCFSAFFNLHYHKAKDEVILVSFFMYISEITFY